MTIEQALREACASLVRSSDAPRLDAERLLLKALEQSESSWLHAHAEETLVDTEQEHFIKLVEQRATGRPLAYILGEWDFHGRTFVVNKHVLIPRPETEALLATALEHIATFAVRPEPYVIADIGTGSGCIAVTLALELQQTTSYKLLATDISEAALVVAKENAERHEVLDQIEFLQGDMLEPLQGRNIDFIVSNPPYVPADELHQLAEAKAGHARDTQGLTFEPHIALDGGPDGTQFTNQLRTSGIPAILETTGGNIEPTQ